MVTFEDDHCMTKLTLHVNVLMATPEVVWILAGMGEGWISCPGTGAGVIADLVLWP